jgi:hypothetical protein
VGFDEPIVGNFEGRKLKIASASLEVEIFREALSKAGRSHAPYSKLEDAELLPIIRRLSAGRRLNRDSRAADKPVVNAKRAHSIKANTPCCWRSIQPFAEAAIAMAR